MAYRVEITDSAIADAREYVRFLQDDQCAPEAAGRWYLGLMEAIESLAEMPRRCPLVPEAEEFEQELRQLRQFSHRIVFALDDPTMIVTVLRVYHAARDRLRDLGRIARGSSGP